MRFSNEATLAINDYVDSVLAATALRPSARYAAADRLYAEIVELCTAAHPASDSPISAQEVRAQLDRLGSAEDSAARLADRPQPWPGDVIAELASEKRIKQGVEQLSRAALTKSAQVLDVAARTLGAAADKLKAKA
ncbi:MAG: hypothetical protein M3T49_03980 [Candidatus Eremiobacteraeota bacterium]|nr:hypothetical protein [Candidatus Eremiobacteraeota bacterium]